MIRSLWRDGAVYAVGTIVSRGLGLLLMPLYTHALPPDSFGLLDLIVTGGTLVNLVVPLETPQAVARFWNERAEGAPRQNLAGTGLAFATISYAVFVVVAWIFAPPIALVLSGEVGNSGAVRAGAACIAASGVMLVLQGQFRWALRPRAYAISGVAYSVLVLGGMAALVAAGAASVASVLWLQGGAAAGVAMACAWSLRKDLALRLDRAEMRAMLRFSLPLVPVGIAMFATLNLNRFVLNSLSTLDEVGLFGIASRLAGMATLVLLGVQSALTPLVYAHHDEPETPARLARLFEVFWALSLLVCLALSVFGREVLTLLVAPAYVDAAPLIVWLAPAAMLAQMYIFSPGIPLAKKTHWQLVLTAASGGLALVLTVALVPHWRAMGAAVSACAASASFFLAWLVAGQRLYRLPLRSQSLVTATIAYIGLAVVAMELTSWPLGGTACMAKGALLIAMLLALELTGLLRFQTIRQLRAQLRKDS